MTTLLVVLAVVFVCAAAFWFFEIDFRWHRHIPKARDYIPPTDVRIKEKP